MFINLQFIIPHYESINSMMNCVHNRLRYKLSNKASKLSNKLSAPIRRRAVHSVENLNLNRIIKCVSMFNI